MGQKPPSTLELSLEGKTHPAGGTGSPQVQEGVSEASGASARLCSGVPSTATEPFETSPSLSPSLSLPGAHDHHTPAYSWGKTSGHIGLCLRGQPSRDNGGT